jgi:hypothetical protein
MFKKLKELLFGGDNKKHKAPVARETRSEPSDEPHEWDAPEENEAPKDPPRRSP